jgi:hypothetical protein
MITEGPIATTGQKVFALTNLPVIWAGAGSTYTIGQFEAALHQLDAAEENVTNIFKAPNTRKIRNYLLGMSRQTLGNAYSGALPGGTNMRDQNGLHPMAAMFLVLGFANDVPYFFGLGYQGEIWWHTPSRFSAIGSGGSFAQVANALMSHYLEGVEIDVDLGLMFAFRAVETTCAVSSGNVGLPVKLAIADSQNARVLSDAELEAVAESVSRWKQVERDSLTFPQEAPPQATPEALPVLETEVTLTNEPAQPS